MDSLCHPWFTTTNVSYRFPTLKLPPPPCAVLLVKIISLDSSQRVPPRSPCPPLIITRVCPWLINHLSDPWNFNKSNGILLRSKWLKPYPNVYGSELFIINGWSRKLARRYLPTFWGGEGGLLIRCWHYPQSPRTSKRMVLAEGTWMGTFAEGFSALSRFHAPRVRRGFAEGPPRAPSILSWSWPPWSLFAPLQIVLGSVLLCSRLLSICSRCSICPRLLFRSPRLLFRSSSVRSYSAMLSLALDLLSICSRSLSICSRSLSICSRLLWYIYIYDHDIRDHFGACFTRF